MEITRTSPFSGKTVTLDLDVTEGQIGAWEKGALAQNIFMHLSPDEREFIMTGIIPGEWEEYLGEGNE